MAKVSGLNRNQRKRINIVLGFFWVILVGLIIRTGYIQLVQGEELRRAAVEQQTRDRLISSKRGTMFDRNGKTLAISATVEQISVSPNQIKSDKNEELIADGLSKILELDKETVLKKIKRNTAYETIKRKVEKEKADEVRAFISENKIKGVNLDEDTKRYYPYGNFASHVIGFVGDDNQGLNGLELVFDKYLKGMPGRVISAKNAAGLEMMYKYEKYIDPQDGANLVLTIDEVIQHFLEKHLETAVIEHKLNFGAAGIVMDVKTGEILAMSTKPDYDLNKPFEITNENIKQQLGTLSGDEYKKVLDTELERIWRNKAVVDTYEPGSTFKIATTAIGIEEKVVNLNDQFYCRGSIKVATEDIRCHKVGGHGSQNFVQGVQNSCNPVFIDIGFRIGADRFYRYMKGLGFRDKTGIELSGEPSGLFWPRNGYNELELATTSFGQGFQVTPLQLITIASAIANEGNMVKPHLVKQLADNDGNVIKSFEPEFVRQIVSKETGDTVRTILESVVSEGTGSNAYVPGYRIAGKTGTSEKLPRGNRKYIASFLGFAPADDPQIACLVILDEPPVGATYYGGTIAAPVAKNIMEESLKYLGVEPEYTTEELQKIDIVVPDLTGYDKASAQKILEDQDKGLKASFQGTGEKVVSQIPKPFEKLVAGSTIILYTDEGNTSKTVIVPNVINSSVVEVNRAIVNAGLNVRIKGLSMSDGKVVCASQTPSAGTAVATGSVVTVEFRYLDVE